MAFIKEAQNPQSRFIEGSPRPEEVKKFNDVSTAQTYSVALDKEVEQVQADIDAGFFPLLKEEARFKAEQQREGRARVQLEESLINRDSEGVSRVQEEFREEEYSAPDIASIFNENPEADRISTRYNERQTAANRIINERLGETNEGWVNWLGYAADTMASTGTQSVLGGAAELTGIGGETFEGAGQLIELAKEGSALLYADITPEEFEREFSNIIDRVSDAGFFSDNNPMYLANFVDMMDEMGRGGTAKTERLFQVLDIAGAVGTAGETIRIAKAAKLGRRTGEVPRNVAKAGSREKAENVVVKQGDNLQDTDMVAEGTSVSLISPGRSTAKATDDFSGPELTTMRNLEAQNTVLDIVKNYNFGKVVSPERLEAAKPTILKGIRDNLKGYKRNEIDVSIRETVTGNIDASVYLGSNKGAPYKTKKAAQKVANTVGGEVVEQIQEGTKKFVVRKDFNVPTEGLADPTDLSDVGTGMLHSIMSSTVRTTAKYDAMLKRGEAQASRALRDIKRELKKAVRQTSRGEQQNVDEAIRLLRDDPNHNWRTESMTEDQFSSFFNKIYKRDPSKGEKNFFKMLRDLSDTDYYINADFLLKEAINNKETMVKLNGAYYRAKVTDPPANSVVYNEDISKLVHVEDLDPTNAIIYEIKDAAYEVPGVGNVKYVTGSKMPTRKMYHTDVLPYNMGGHRKYSEDVRFFLRQEVDDLHIAGGETTKGNPLTFMGVRTEDEAKAVVTQWNNITEALRRGGDDVDEVVSNNNDWNPSIEDLADFQEFGREHGLDVTKDISWSGDNVPLEGSTGWAGEKTVGERFINGMNTSKQRSTRPLVGYGGDPLGTVNPLESIQRGFASKVARRADHRYLFNAVNGWKQAALNSNSVKNIGDVRDLPSKQFLEKAELDTNTRAGKALDQERQTINFRMSSLDEGSQVFQRAMGSIADYAYEKSGKNKLSKSLDSLAKTDPAGFLRKVAFNTKLGMFAPDQIYVQASQVMNITAITGLNPVRAYKGLSSIPALRVALMDNVDNTQTLRDIARRQASLTGISEDDFIEMREWIKQSGRNVLDNTIVEENNAYKYFAGKVDSTLEAGQVFFREGELIARLNSAVISFLEHKKRYPNVDVFSDQATDALIRRQDILTASMTSASAAPWQKSLFAVPLQFTTYIARMYEQLFTNRVLTGAERVRLGTAQVLFYGAAGVPGAGFLMDRMAYNTDSEIDKDAYNLIRYGMIDKGISELTGTDTALSTRIAAGEGIYQMVRDMATQGLFETAAGPGGQITYDIFSSSAKAFNSLFNPNAPLDYDWHRIARNATSYNRAYTLWQAQRYGIYTSRKSEEPIMEDMTNMEGFLKAAGIPLAEEDQIWTTVSNMMLDNAMLDTKTKEVQRLQNILERHIEDENFMEAVSVSENIEAELSLLTGGERDKVLERLSYNSSMIENIVRQLMTKGKTEAASRLMEYQNGES